jgi:hypothetical protein
MSPPAFKPSMTGHFFVPYPADGVSPEEIRSGSRRTRGT